MDLGVGSLMLARSPDLEVESAMEVVLVVGSPLGSSSKRGSKDDSVGVTRQVNSGAAQSISVAPSGDKERAAQNNGVKAAANFWHENKFKWNRKGFLAQSLCYRAEFRGTKVKLQPDHLKELDGMWGFCLVGYLQGARVPYPTIASWMKNLGKNMDYKGHESGWHVFRFKTEEDMLEILHNGPYMIQGRPMQLRRMSGSFTFSEADLAHAPVWVRLPRLPLSFWSADALSIILSSIGEPIMMDKCTEQLERISYARAQVMIDVSKDIPNHIEIEDPDGKTIMQEVVVEYNPKFCTHCCKLGHMLGSCRKLGELTGTEQMCADPSEEAGRGAPAAAVALPTDNQAGAEVPAGVVPTTTTGGAPASDRNAPEKFGVPLVVGRRVSSSFLPAGTRSGGSVPGKAAAPLVLGSGEKSRSQNVAGKSVACESAGKKKDASPDDKADLARIEKDKADEGWQSPKKTFRQPKKTITSGPRVVAEETYQASASSSRPGQGTRGLGSRLSQLSSGGTLEKNIQTTKRRGPDPG